MGQEQQLGSHQEVRNGLAFAQAGSALGWRVLGFFSSSPLRQSDLCHQAWHYMLPGSGNAFLILKHGLTCWQQPDSPLSHEHFETKVAQRSGSGTAVSARVPLPCRS